MTVSGLFLLPPKQSRNSPDRNTGNSRKTMPKQPETAAETVPETAKLISIEMVRLFRPIALRPLRSGRALPSATLAAHRSNRIWDGRKGQGGRGRKAAHHPQHTANARLRPHPIAAKALDEQLSARSLAWCGFRREITVIGGIITSYADTVQTRKRETRDSVVSIGLSGDRPHDGKSREGIYARVAAASFTLVDGKMGARDRSRNLYLSRYVGLRRAKDRGAGRWPPILSAPPLIDVFRLVRAASEKFGRPSKENLVYK
jgi:hypothetical protein